MEYTVVSNWTLSVLIENVNKLIAKGWIPCGGVAFGGDPEKTTKVYLQAMIRMIPSNTQDRPNWTYFSNPRVDVVPCEHQLIADVVESVIQSKT